MRSLPRYGHPCSTYDDDMECVILLTHDTTACLCLPLFSLHHSYTYNIMHVVPSEGSRLECLFSHHWFYFFIGKCSIIQITPKINFFKLHIIEFHFQHHSHFPALRQPAISTSYIKLKMLLAKFYYIAFIPRYSSVIFGERNFKRNER